MEAAKVGIHAGVQGQSWCSIARATGQEIKRGLKYKVIPIAVAKKAAKSTATKGYKKTIG